MKDKLLRIIARLDIKGSNLVKGIHLEGLRVIGNPNKFAKEYYSQGIDEIFYHDCVASLYGRKSSLELIKIASSNIFVPFTVGGGISSVEDANDIFRSGADKISINSAAISRPLLIREIADFFGSQSLVLSVEAKKISNNYWEAYTENGRERTGKNVNDWIREAIDLGIGEILITSIDKEGTGTGCDLELLKTISSYSKIPIIASGGIGKPDDFIKAITIGGADAVAIAHMLHYKNYKVQDIRDLVIAKGFKLRNYEKK